VYVEAARDEAQQKIWTFCEAVKQRKPNFPVVGLRGNFPDHRLILPAIPAKRPEVHDIKKGESDDEQIDFY